MFSPFRFWKTAPYSRFDRLATNDHIQYRRGSFVRFEWDVKGLLGADLTWVTEMKSL
jgi:hypothetical protein